MERDERATTVDDEGGEREERATTVDDEGEERDERATTVDDEGADTPDEERPTTADIASGTETRARAGDAKTDEVNQIEEDQREPLLADDATSDVRSRWEQIQASFVDEPRRAVEEADTLVAELMQRLADSFAQEREGLEDQWDRGDEVSTEDLRIALQRYRSFFDRLLSA
jgi:hypothetical protein